MSVYRYTASARGHEGHEDSGTVVAKNSVEAREKLTEFEYDKVRLRRITGLSAFLIRFTADVK